MRGFDIGRTHFELRELYVEIVLVKWDREDEQIAMGPHPNVPGDSVEGLLSVSSSLGVSKLPVGW